MKQINLEGHDYMSQRTVNATARQTAIPVSAQKPAGNLLLIQHNDRDVVLQYMTVKLSMIITDFLSCNLNSTTLLLIARIAATLFT
ncbi:hypothetical protein T08_7998 [Trichinella sp. T8]|uniref:Uncharacterized protein n=1 Tax=Trichinella murrelli TaxID=144512 RepID=A0A0V0UIL6_9BILA|nr:hypothetical protein T05_14807 [Trichinella murrelli]KRZ88666.1 hypothetical protein T08_1946 [Trichinella sp. T8]KRZ88673.1 hypothetical protein T08_7998 [Trichinella sp. T8]